MYRTPAGTTEPKYDVTHNFSMPLTSVKIAQIMEGTMNERIYSERAELPNNYNPFSVSFGIQNTISKIDILIRQNPN